MQSVEEKVENLWIYLPQVWDVVAVIFPDILRSEKKVFWSSVVHRPQQRIAPKTFLALGAGVWELDGPTIRGGPVWPVRPEPVLSTDAQHLRNGRMGWPALTDGKRSKLQQPVVCFRNLVLMALTGIFEATCWSCRGAFLETPENTSAPKSYL